MTDRRDLLKAAELIQKAADLLGDNSFEKFATLKLKEALENLAFKQGAKRTMAQFHKTVNELE